jgi:hypothetical protein
MQSSAIVAFVAGAALASGIVYEAVKPKPEALIRVDTPVVAEQPTAPAPPARAEKPSPVAPDPPPVAIAEHTKKTETPKPSPPLTARLESVTYRVPLSDAVKADLPMQPVPAPQSVQEAPAPTPVPAPAPEPPPPPPPAVNTVTLQAGANLNVRVGETLSTRQSRVGDNFLATLTDPLVIDGWVIAERGARVEGRVVDSDPGKRVQGVARLSVELVRLTTSDGQRIRIQTEPIDRKAKASTGEDAAKVGGGAALGAIIGAVAGGGRGAGIGAGAGGAAGAGDVLLTRGKAAEIPVETRLGFRVTSPVEITEQKQR